MRKLSKRDLTAYVGDYSQVMGIKEFELKDGKSRGLRAYQIINGQGLDMTVLADKCLNIPYLSFKGVNIGFISKVGVCAPEYYQEDKARGYLRNFEAGFLTTCGLTYMGSPCVEADGRALGLHGPISNTPAENVSSSMEWQGNIAHMTVKGTVREACLFEENLVLTREMAVNSQDNTILITDRVENRGFDKQPLMLLYHFNFGYPFLDQCTKVFTNYDIIEARDAHSQKGIQNCDAFSAPVIGLKEEVFFRKMGTLERGDGKVVIYNKELQIGVTMKFDARALPVLTHWKSPRAGDYALGIEPGTCHVGGRVRAREENSLAEIEPGETKEFKVLIQLNDYEEKIREEIHSVMTS